MHFGSREKLIMWNTYENQWQWENTTKVAVVQANNYAEAYECYHILKNHHGYQKIAINKGFSKQRSLQLAVRGVMVWHDFLIIIISKYLLYWIMSGEIYQVEGIGSSCFVYDVYITYIVLAFHWLVAHSVWFCLGVFYVSVYLTHLHLLAVSDDD